jgi:NOL1/NOP2/fmu family ribosome biogenesis protein
MSTVEKVAQAAPKQTKVKLLYSAEHLKLAQLIGEKIGRQQALNDLQKAINANNVIELSKIKKSKWYKGLQVIIDGEPVTISTFEGYCIHVEGRSGKSVDNDLANLNLLGEELFTALHQIGIGQIVMRRYCKLPDDDKKALLKLAQTGDKASFAEMAATLIKRNKKNSA